MSNNSIFQFLGAKTGDVGEGLGITRTDGTTGDNWNQTVGGLILQGGLIGTVGADIGVRVEFQLPFPKKLLGVFTQPIYAPLAAPASYNAGMVFARDLTGFTFDNYDTSMQDCYWWAIGF